MAELHDDKVFMAIRNPVAGLKSDLDLLRSDLGSQMEKLGAQIMAQRQTLEAEIKALAARQDAQKEAIDSRYKILQWLVLTAISVAGVAATLFGILVANNLQAFSGL